MTKDYAEVPVRFSRKEIEMIDRLRIADGYGSRNAIFFDAVKGLIEQRLNEPATIYVPGVEMGGSVHKGTGKAEQ